MANTPVTAEDEVKERGRLQVALRAVEEVGRLANLSRLVRQESLRARAVVQWKSSGDGLAAFLNLEGTGGFQRLLRRGNPAGQVAQSASPFVRRDHLHSQRPGRHLGLDRSQHERNLRSGRRAVTFRFR